MLPKYLLPVRGAVPASDHKRRYGLKPLLRGLAGAGIGLLSIACGGDDGAGTDPAEGVQGRAGLCADLVLLDQSLDKVRALNAASPTADAMAARDAVQFSLAELQEAETDVPTRLIALLQTSFQDFDATLDSLGSGGNDPVTLGVYAAPLQASAAGLYEGHEEIEALAGCPD